MKKACLKIASNEHVEMLYRWANDQETRNNSLNTASIPYKEHKKWFEKKMSSNQCKIYIYYYNNIPIGQIRLDFDFEQATISYSIEKEYRGIGHGKKILMLMEKEIIGLNNNTKYLFAVVKYSNIASQKLFEQLGYDKTYKQEYIEYYKKIEDIKL